MGAKAISKRHVRRDWLIIPDSIAFYLYESVNKVSPKAGQFLAEAVQTPVILETRYEKASSIHGMAREGMGRHKPTSIQRDLWDKKQNHPSQSKQHESHIPRHIFSLLHTYVC